MHYTQHVQQLKKVLLLAAVLRLFAHVTLLLKLKAITKTKMQALKLCYAQLKSHYAKSYKTLALSHQ